MFSRPAWTSLRFPFVALPIAAAIGLLLVWWVVPVDKVGSIGLRLVFDGADRGRYPNGVPFSPEEVTEAGILKDVYRRLDLKGRGSFESFSTGFFVSRSSIETERVHQTYRSMLADTKLSPVDRSRIEAEYQGHLKSVAGEPEIVLGFRQPSGFGQLSSDEVQKVLEEVAKTWSEDAVATKGATRFDVGVSTGSTIDDKAIGSEELAVAGDFLRVALLRQRETLDLLEKQPGFAGAQLADGGLSLADVKADVQDLIQLRVQPLLRECVVAGYLKEPGRVRSYYRSRGQQAELARQQAASQSEGLQQVIRSYVASQAPVAGMTTRSDSQGGGTMLIPQMTEAFLERLMTLSDSQEDVAFRQLLTTNSLEFGQKQAALEREVEFYRDAQSVANGARPISFVDTTPAYADLQARFTQALSLSKATAEKIERLYVEVSARSLVSGSVFYRQVREFKYSSYKAFGVGRALTLSVLFLAFSIVCAVLLQWRFGRSRDHDLAGAKA